MTDDLLGCPGAADGPIDHVANVQASGSARKAVQPPGDRSFVAATGGQERAHHLGGGVLGERIRQPTGPYVVEVVLGGDTDVRATLAHGVRDSFSGAEGLDGVIDLGDDFASLVGLGIQRWELRQVAEVLTADIPAEVEHDHVPAVAPRLDRDPPDTPTLAQESWAEELLDRGRPAQSIARERLAQIPHRARLAQPGWCVVVIWVWLGAGETTAGYGGFTGQACLWPNGKRSPLPGTPDNLPRPRRRLR